MLRINENDWTTGPRRGLFIYKPAGLLYVTLRRTYFSSVLESSAELERLLAEASELSLRYGWLGGRCLDWKFRERSLSNTDEYFAMTYSAVKSEPLVVQICSK